MSGFDDGASQASSRRSRSSAVGADTANSSKQLNFSDPAATKFLSEYFPLFPLFKTYKQAHMQIVTLFGMCVFAVQHVAFLINPHFSEEWGSIMGDFVSKILYAFQLTLYDPLEVTAVSGPTPLIVYDYVLLVGLIVFLGCVMVHLLRKEDREEAKGITAGVARVLLDGASSLFFIPILQCIFASMVCDGNNRMWMLPGTTSGKCWEPKHLACFIPAALLLAVLTPIVYLKKACVYDYNPLTDNFTARRYSTLDKLTFLHDLAAVFLFSLMNAYNAKTGYAVLMIFNSAMLVVAYVYYLPFYSVRVTRFYVVVHSLELLAAIFLTASRTNHLFLTSTLSSSLFLGVGVLLVIVVLIVADYRVNPNYVFAMKRSAQCVPTPAMGFSEVDPLNVRGFDEAKMFQVNEAEVSNLPYPKGLVTTDIFSQYVGLNTKVVESIMRQGINTYLDNFEAQLDTHRLLPVLESYVDRVCVSTDVQLAVGFLDLFVKEFGLSQASPMMLLFAANIYSRALVTFPDDPNVLQGFTSFIVTYLPGLSFMGVDLVKRMMRLPTTIDQQFRAQKQINELRLALGIRTHAHSVRSVKARMAHAKVLQSVNRFWGKLTEPSVNVKEVSELADEISVRRRAAVTQFDLALRRQQNADPVLLRRLGDFFAEILMAPDAAQECYEESKDIAEARQSRSMRGTRAHAVEVDVIALTERQCAVLATHSKSSGSSQMPSSVSSNLMQYFSAFVTVFFLILVACSCVFLFIASSLTSDMRDLLDSTMAVTSLRIASSRFGSALIGYTLTRNADTVVLFRAAMQDLTDTFANHLEYITTGKGHAYSKEGKFLMSQNTIPMYSSLIDNSEGFSLRSLSESYLQGMTRFMNESVLVHPTGYSENEQFIMQSGKPLSDAFEELITVQKTHEMDALSLRWIIWFTVVFAIGILSLVITYAALALAFRRIALTRVLTFQLFTLIPYEALERLATEAKERFHHIHVEKTLRQAPEGLKDGNGTSGLGGGGRTTIQKTEEPSAVASWQATQTPPLQGVATVEGVVVVAGERTSGVVDDVSASPLTAAVPPTLETVGEAAAGSLLGSPAPPLLMRVAPASPQGTLTTAAAPLRSCLKGANGVTSFNSNAGSGAVSPKSVSPTRGAGGGRGGREKERRVRFNPVVEVVGGGALEAGKDAREAAAKRQGDEEEADGDIDVLLLAEAGARHSANKKKVTETVDDGHNALRGTLAYFSVILACFIVSVVLLGVTTVEPMDYVHGLSAFRHFQDNLNDIFLHVPRVMAHTTSFLRWGSVNEFQTAQDHNSYTCQDIPKLMGSELPLSVSSSLTRMHRTAQYVANLSIDVAVLAARSHQVSLRYWGDARNRGTLSDEDLLALMDSKYKGSMERVDSIAAYVGTLPMDLKVAYAYSIWYDYVIPNLRNFRSSYFSVMKEVAAHVASRAVLSRPYLGVVIGLSAFAIVISLLIAVTPFQRIIEAYITRKHTIFTAFAFTPVLVLSIVLFCMGSIHDEDQMDGYAPTLHALDESVEALLSYKLNTGYFSHSVIPARFFDASYVDTTTARYRLSDVIMRRYGASTEVMSLFRQLMFDWSFMNRLSNISAAVTINAFGGYVRMEEPMLESLESTKWDFSIEKDFYVRTALYTAVGATEQDDIPYSNKIHDLGLPISQQYGIAVDTITSGSYARAFDSCIEAISKLYDIFIDGSHKDLQRAAKKRMAVLYAALGACAFPLIACVVMGSSALAALRFVFQVTASSSSSSSGSAMKNAQLATTASTSESARYGSMLSRARYCLLLVGLLFSATFGVGIWLTQTGYTFTEQLASIGERQSLVSSTFYLIRQLVSSHLSFVAPGIIQEEIIALADRLVTLTDGHVSVGVPIGLFLSDDINRMNFGPTDLEVQLPIATSFMMSNCSRILSPAGAPLPLRDPAVYGTGLTMPVTEALGDWTAMVLRTVALMEDISGQSLLEMESYVDSLNAIASTLHPVLKMANYQVLAAMEAFNRRTSTALLVLAVLTLIVTLAVYLVIVVPTIVRLFREEESLRMLLHMIPPAVRDEVPAISQFMETGQVTNMAALQKKFDANEKLLQNILPQKIAARLKSGELPIADTHECVTMLFTDFVGFTKRSTTMQAREIVDFLNEVFLEFDTIVELLSLEKIKTIGDAFFMAGGLDPLVTDHALRVVEAGLKFFEALEEHNRRHPSRQPLRMRLGIHTGPVVAGVIGTKKVAYDLWGESVEIANALESTGVPGYVHISEETAKYVRGFFRLQPRGELPREKEHIPEKMPKTYLVVGRELPTPYMHLRRPRLLPTNFQEKDKDKEKESAKPKEK